METVNKSNDQNPKFLFNCTHTELLTAIVNGEIDAKSLAMSELRNRGLNAKGEWIGF